MLGKVFKLAIKIVVQGIVLREAVVLLYDIGRIQQFTTLAGILAHTIFEMPHFHIDKVFLKQSQGSPFRQIGLKVGIGLGRMLKILVLEGFLEHIARTAEQLLLGRRCVDYILKI